MTADLEFFARDSGPGQAVKLNRLADCAEGAAREASAIKGRVATVEQEVESIAVTTGAGDPGDLTVYFENRLV